MKSGKDTKKHRKGWQVLWGQSIFMFTRPWFLGSCVRKSLHKSWTQGFPCGSSGKKKIRLQCGRPGFDPWVGKIPWSREWLPTPVFWSGEFHGLYSPWCHKQSDTTEQLSLSLSWPEATRHGSKTPPPWPINLSLSLIPRPFQPGAPVTRVYTQFTWTLSGAKAIAQRPHNQNQSSLSTESPAVWINILREIG